MSKIGHEGTTRTTTRITQKNDLVQLNTKNKKKWNQQQLAQHPTLHQQQ